MHVVYSYVHEMYRVTSSKSVIEKPSHCQISRSLFGTLRPAHCPWVQ